MHYLIQKTSRQHIAVADDMPCPVECVKVAADADGWVRYRGERCPVPLRSRVDVVAVGATTLNCDVFRGVPAADINWSRVEKYRPECDTISTAFDRLHEAGRALAESAESAAGLDRIMARAGETMPPPPATAPAHDTAAMLLSVVCAFAIGALIGWGWM